MAIMAVISLQYQSFLHEMVFPAPFCVASSTAVTPLLKYLFLSNTLLTELFNVVCEVVLKGLGYVLFRLGLYKKMYTMANHRIGIS